MGFRERTGLLLIGFITIAITIVFYHETGHLPARTGIWAACGVSLILMTVIIRPIIWSPIKNVHIIYVDKNKNILKEGPKLTEEDVRIVEQVLNKMAFPYLGIDEEIHQTQALRIVSKHMKVIVYFLYNGLDDEEPNYVKVGKYLFSVKLNNEEMQMIKDVLSNYETFGDKQ